MGYSPSADVSRSLGVASSTAIPDTAGMVIHRVDNVTAVASIEDLRSVFVQVPKLGYVSESIVAASFTDDEGNGGTYTMQGTVPLGAIVLATKCLVTAGFTGDVSCIMRLGDEGDPDRFHTGTPSIFTTAATGIDMGEPSGERILTAAVTPIVTIASDADITPVIAGPGAMTVTIYYIQTV